MDPIYLDYNATTPIDREVAESMAPFLYGFFGNPSSNHPYGKITREAIEHARLQVSVLLAAIPEEIVFTSGGTEANNYAIRGYCLANRSKGNQIITSAIEHPAVMEVCRSLEDEGFELTVLPVDQTGMVNPEDLRKAIQSKTILVSIMHANNEVGTIQPIQELAKIAHQNGAVFHSDAAQSVGKIPVDVKNLDVDLLSVAGHKLYGPKGVGALYIRDGIKLAKLMHGASHESNRRPGTENVLEIVGLGKACEIAGRDLKKNMHHYQLMRDQLVEGLRNNLGEEMIRLNGHPQKRLPNTASISFHNLEANTLLTEINDQVAASAGAACHADEVDLSIVLEAMRVPVEWAMGTVRFSVGRETTEEQIDRAIQIVTSAVRSLRSSSKSAAPILREPPE